MTDTVEDFPTLVVLKLNLSDGGVLRLSGNVQLEEKVSVSSEVVILNSEVECTSYNWMLVMRKCMYIQCMPCRCCPVSS